MQTTDTNSELIALERKYWRAMKERDVETALQLTDFPCIVAGPQGFMKVEEPAFRKMLSERKYEIDSVEVSADAQVRLIRDDVAVVAYQIHEELIVDGKPAVCDATDSSTWIRRDGQWKCAAHTEAVPGNPFKQPRSREPKDKRRFE